MKRYINNVLVKKLIKFFILFTNIFILFISKKDKKLRLYINYKKLNIITIKNCYLLFFIIEILNYLNDLAYFIKFDNKNIYYRIQIK